MKNGNNMKRILIYIFITLISAVAHGMELNTKSFTIDIQNNCPEGEVTCDKVSYTGTRKSDGSKIHLIGHTLNNKNTVDLYGYTFKNGDYTYSIYIQSAEFILEKNGNLIVTEKGEWSEGKKSDVECSPLDFANNKESIDDYRSGEVCFFKNKPLLDAYSKYRSTHVENGKYLDRKITKMIDINKKNVSGVELTYNWKNTKKLNIEIMFPGGLTYITLDESDNGTKISTIYDPD